MRPCNFISGPTAGYNVKIFGHPQDKIAESEARLQRTPTLDGSAVLVHNGQADEDMILKLSGPISETEEDQLWAIHRQDTLVSLSCNQGFFDGAIRRLSTNNGQLSLTFWVSEKIA